MARLIDADALRKRLFNYYDCVNEFTSKSTYTGETLMDYEVADMIEACIDNADTVDAVPVVHGRMFLGRHPTNVVLTHQCSKCVAYMLPQDNYCPNCGAKMDGGSDHD